MRRSILQTIILYLYFLLPSSIGFASIYKLPIGDGMRLSEQLWRWDLTDFRIENGLLLLDAPQDKHQSAVFTTIEIGERCLWQGKVYLKQTLSIQNTNYILLCSLEQNSERTQFVYMALELGSKELITSLTKLTLQRTNTSTPSPFKITNKEYLIRDTFHPLSYAPLQVSYTINYIRDKGWQLSLDYDGKRSEIGQIAGYNIPAGRNSFGLLCNYSPKHHQGIGFGALAISDDVNEDIFNTTTPPNTAPQPDSTQPKMGSPLITEIMYNPKPNKAEYIEIYNPNKNPLPLDGYGLYIGKSLDKATFYDLSSLTSIPAETYLVLTSQPQALREEFPNLEENLIKQFPLPRLVNTGFHIGIATSEGVPTDMLYFEANQLNGSLKKKKGIPLVRKSLIPAPSEEEAPKLWNFENTTSIFPSPGEENKISDNGQEESMSPIEQLRVWIKNHPRAKLTCVFYDMRGYRLRSAEGESVNQWLNDFFEQPVPSLRLLNLPLNHPLLLQVIGEVEDEIEYFTIPFINP